MKKFTIFTVLIILFVPFGFAIAQTGGKRGDKGYRHEGRWSIYTGLNLTEEQRTKIDAMSESLKNELAPVRTELIKKRMELDLLWMDNSPDADKIKTKQREIRDLRGTMEDKLTDFRLSVNNILTPEQRVELLTKKSHRKSFSRRKMGWAPR